MARSRKQQPSLGGDDLIGTPMSDGGAPRKRSSRQAASPRKRAANGANLGFEAFSVGAELID